MTTKFVDTFGEIVSLKAGVTKSKNAAVSIGVQSKSAPVQEDGAQTNVGDDVECQTEDLRAMLSITKDGDQEVQYNWHILNDFLIRSEPLILRTIAENRRTARLFAVYDAASIADERESNVALDHALRSENWPEGSQALSVGWNSSGTTVGVACGRMTHEYWCTHRGYVMTWNVDRGRLNVNKADRTYETTSCCTCLAFHPALPNLVASCTYTGDVLVFSLSDEGDPVASAQLDDQGVINCVTWLPEASSASLVLASGGADGRVLIWTVPSKGRTLALTRAFQLTVSNLPRSVRGKIGGENKGTGVGTLTFGRPPLASRFMVGTETGGVFQCTTDASESSTIIGTVTIAGSDGTVSCYDPVALIQKPHNGPVYKVAYHHRNPTVLASCGADGFIRLGTVFQTLPALEIDTSLGNLYDLSWSPMRPCVFSCSTSNGRLLVFDLTQAMDRPTLNVEATTQDKMGPLLAVAFNPRRSNVVATGDAFGCVKVWNLGDAFSSAQVGEETILEQLVALATDRSSN